MRWLGVLFHVGAFACAGWAGDDVDGVGVFSACGGGCVSACVLSGTRTCRRAVCCFEVRRLPHELGVRGLGFDVVDGGGSGFATYPADAPVAS